jgi:polar amino acid transport system substrate-binding protein
MKGSIAALCTARYGPDWHAGQPATVLEAPMSLADHRHALAPLGHLRVAINLGNPVLAQGDANSPRGPSVELATALAQRLGVQACFSCHDAAASVVAAASDDAWDLAFLAVDPARADRIAFSAPYVEIEGTYLVRDDSPAQRVADLDRNGLRIAVGRGAAYDLFLSRELRHATIERADTSAAAITLFDQQRLDAAAGVR